MRFTSNFLVRSCALAGAFVLTACPADTGTSTATEPVDTTTGDEPTSTTGTTASEPTTTTGTTASETTTTTGTTDTTGDDMTPVIPVPPVCDDPAAPRCDDPVEKCNEDTDRDAFPFSCDNAPEFINPGQEDMDGDGFGDIADLCPTVASMENTPDTDRDGVGNDCDVCSRTLNIYNKQNEAVPFYMRVRAMPSQADSDRDGVGDACDNCVRVANCQGFGDGPGLSPHVVGQLADVEDPGCQADADVNLIGDACEGATAPGAAGPVGFLDGDDFDQDGLRNIDDACPRQPVAHEACEGDGECPEGATCSAAKICNHVDHDGDKVGDICDTCPWSANPEQITEGGDATDDVDNDFIGAACEQDECATQSNARPFAFYDVSANGFCCVTSYHGQPLVDPDGEPLDVADLPELPPGVLELPAGCEEALAHSEDGKAHPIKACHVDAPSDLWQYFCIMPAWDQEFDGVPDACDLCPFAFDPSNAPYVDAEMKEWPNFGKYCNGDYKAENYDPANMCLP